MALDVNFDDVAHPIKEVLFYHMQQQYIQETE